MPESVARTALVTGASGGIGRRLCVRLQTEGWRVIGLSSRQAGRGPWHSYVIADLSKPDCETASLEKACGSEVETVWHLAGKAHALAELGQDPAEYNRANAEGTRQALALARRLGARRFVLASSVKAMGEGGFTIEDETAPCAPTSAYGRSKLAAEQFVFAEGAIDEPVVLRFCMVYGAEDRGNMARMMDAVRGARFPPFPDTHNRRSFVYVEDVVSACLLAGTAAAAARQVFLVTDGQLYSTRELYLAMRKALGLPPPRFTLPLWFFRLLAKVGDFGGWVTGHRLPLDTGTLAKLTDSAAYTPAKISKLLGYAPAWPLGRGLAAMARATCQPDPAG